MQPVKQKKPIRIFTDPRLERLAHTPPIVPFVTWLAISTAAVTIAALRSPGWHIPAGFLAGLFTWTLAEYALHRFIFHIRSERKALKIIGFMFHGVHHAQPRVRTRLFMPLVTGIPIAAIFFGLFNLVAGVLLGGDDWVLPLFGGFVFGYEVYSSIHFSTHEFTHWKLLQPWRRYHMRHHGRDYTVRFGVSSPLWDLVFGTYPHGA